MKPVGCRLLPAIGATDVPAVHLSGESCVRRAAPLRNIRQGWRVSREKRQRGGLEEAAGLSRGMWDQLTSVDPLCEYD